jgi:hypothetical protein
MAGAKPLQKQGRILQFYRGEHVEVAKPPGIGRVYCVNDVILYVFNLNVIIYSMPNRINIVLFIKNSFTTIKIKIENTYYKKLVYNTAMLQQLSLELSNLSQAF